MLASTWSSDIASIKKYVHLYDEMHPFIYNLKGGRRNTGEIHNVWSEKETRDLVLYVREKSPNTLLIPTIFRWENNSELIMEAIGAKDPDFKIRSRHIEAILKEIDLYGWDGIDIDYEGMGCDRKEAFEDFLIELKKKLKEKDKLLSVAIHPKTAIQDTIDFKCPGLKQNIKVDYFESYKGQWTHDYEFLGKVADKIKIMAYELYPRGPGFPGPGPQAPLDWIEKILDYALAKIPKEKLYMAIPTYGYDWPLNCEGETKAVYYSYARKIIREKNPLKKEPTSIPAIMKSYPRSTNEWPELDPYLYRHLGKVYEDPSLWYTVDGCDHVAFYMNRGAFATKYNALKKRKIAGFSFWQLVRDNDPEIHTFLEEAIKENHRESLGESVPKHN
ncbi:glycosyl hydrolase, family 18 [Leptospira ryugenii]|uniref:Glycosyl hydrolase, family 18 n=2 Tax=Leptospira ryugenii TaxID=1917863 RepID=A0A2P2E0L2_9LEPT|nr:glycosyl hydrolase, family 18 [Leptospira ryugenii]